jgi:hypothetical protein
MRLPRVRFTVQRTMAVVAFAAFLLGLGFCVVNHSITAVQIAFADEQTAIFEQMREETAGSAGVDVDYLEYTLSYYPSGSKQIRGSRLDRVVERAREGAVREMIGILRARTGKEYGDDPRRWIEGLRSAGMGGMKPGA